jgi:di/tricarboxylate transporter
VETSTVEVLITPGCRMVGRRLGELRLRRRYGVYPLAVHRRNQNIGRQLDDLVVRVGDTLLLKARPRISSGWPRTWTGRRLAALRARVPARPCAHRLAALFGIVVLAALGVAPILMLSILAVALVLAHRCIDADEAFSFVDGRLLALIFSMLAVGAALESLGRGALIVEASAPA